MVGAAINSELKVNGKVSVPSLPRKCTKFKRKKCENAHNLIKSLNKFGWEPTVF